MFPYQHVGSYRMRKQNCPSCSYSWCENIKDNDMVLRKVCPSIPSVLRVTTIVL